MILFQNYRQSIEHVFFSPSSKSDDLLLNPNTWTHSVRNISHHQSEQSIT